MAWTPALRASYNSVRDAVLAKVPGLVVTGDVGVGKTTFLKALLNDPQIEPSTRAVYLRSGFAEAADLLEMVASELPDDGSGEAETRILAEQDRLGVFGRSILVVLDEAQAGSPEGVVALYRLACKGGHVSVLVAGQPELRGMLMRRVFAGFDVPAEHRHTLSPPDEAGIGTYLATRMGLAGAQDVVFAPDAIPVIAKAAGCIPRKVNKIGDACLFLASQDGRRNVDGAFVQKVLDEDMDAVTLALTPHAMRSTISAERAFEVELPVDDPEQGAVPVAAAGIPAPEVTPVAAEKTGPALAPAPEVVAPAAAPIPEDDAPVVAEEVEPVPELAPEADKAFAYVADVPVSEAAEPDYVEGALDPGEDVAFDYVQDAPGLELPPTVVPAQAEKDEIEAVRPAAEVVELAEISRTRWVKPAAGALIAASAVLAAVLVLRDGASPQAAAVVAPAPAPAPAAVADAAEPTPESAVGRDAPVKAVADAMSAALLPKLEAIDAPAEEAALAFYEQALEHEKAELIAMDFARAALRGHARSATYLGQMFDMGDGVSFSPDVAARWYALADGAPTDGIGGSATGDAAATPLLARAQGDIVDLVWDGRGASFRVELADAEREIIGAYETALTAARLAKPAEAAFWRVAADDKDFSDWSPIEN